MYITTYFTYSWCNTILLLYTYNNNYITRCEFSGRFSKYGVQRIILYSVTLIFYVFPIEFTSPPDLNFVMNFDSDALTTNIL